MVSMGTKLVEKKSHQTLLSVVEAVLVVVLVDYCWSSGLPGAIFLKCRQQYSDTKMVCH